MFKTDIQLKKDIEHELRWDPKVNSAQIGISVDNGVVSLFGIVDTYAEKRAAETITRLVGGVRTVAQELSVKILTDHVRSDSDIAAATQKALESDVCVPATVTARVEGGSVTLEGQVTWNYEREAAERTIVHLAGVLAVFNLISIEPQTSPKLVKESVQAALQRQGATNATAIHVETEGTEVTLSGHASCWRIIEDATNAAWAAPGVTQVFDHVKLTQ